MKIYVAGNFAEDRDRCRSIAHRLQSFGHSITWKWFDTPKEYYGAHNALHDLAGVRDADLLIVLMDEDREFRGTWCEVGAALITGKPCFFIGTVNKDKNVFRKHPLAMSIFSWYFAGELAPIIVASKHELRLNETRNGHLPGQSCQVCCV